MDHPYDQGPVEIPPERKGRLLPPILLMVFMLTFGIYIFLMTRTAPSSAAPVSCFTLDEGTLYFHQEYYTGGPELTVPATIGGKPVLALGEGCFEGADLTAITLPDTVEHIADRAFHYCDRLRGIKLPEGVRSIGAYSFAGCSSLEAIYIPASVEQIGLNAFLTCPELEHVFITGTLADWEGLYPQKTGENTNIYTVSGPDATDYVPAG